MNKKGGYFTLPGESGYEELTLELAKRWGADVIRDSDGTELSEEIINAGYGIYSTICIIRDHNEWAKFNEDALQQTFLVTSPQVAVQENIIIDLMKEFYEKQFQINDSCEALEYYQVYDRTTNQLVDKENWIYDREKGTVVIKNCTKWHKYTVSFLVYRIWEEISMYNHVTNNWDKEHQMQIDPRHKKTQVYMLEWMEKWCENHPETTVVRFTSMFYNFVWMWGSSEKNRNLFTDWGSYDFTVSPIALKQFEEKYGYAIVAEDFINKGMYQVTHMPPTKAKENWMEFINDFVIDFGKKLIEIVHRYGKKAYVFYDDSWVGIEPYNDRFKEFGFDGLIKCVFSGYEARLCSGVDVETHEIRLHPYLFPVGLGGAPTFAEGGNPTLDAKKYWVNVRRAILRAPIDRIGLGGYLHLTEKFPEFNDYIEQVADEFRMIKEHHEKGNPHTIKVKVAVLHYWGKLRSWTLSGHFHETDTFDLIHINEALAGLPVEVDFIDFNDLKKETLEDYQVIINAGEAGSAWSGGNAWSDSSVIEKITEWVYNGGCFIGVNEPSAVDGADTYFRMAHVLGIDKDLGARVCHGKWESECSTDTNMLEAVIIPEKKKLYITSGDVEVIKKAKDGTPLITKNRFGEGVAIYFSGFRFSNASTRMLYNILLEYTAEKKDLYITDNFNVECTYFPKTKTLIVINNSHEKQSVKIISEENVMSIKLKAFETKEIKNA